MATVELLILIASTPMIVLARLLRVIHRLPRPPPILAYLLAEIIIDQTVPGLIRTAYNVVVIGSIGTAILIFHVGLETNIDAASRYGRDSFLVVLGVPAVSILGEDHRLWLIACISGVSWPSDSRVGLETGVF